MVKHDFLSRSIDEQARHLSRVPEAPQHTPAASDSDPLSLYQRAQTNPGSLSPQGVISLQRHLGNQAVMRLLGKDRKPKRVAVSEDPIQRLPDTLSAQPATALEWSVLPASGDQTRPNSPVISTIQRALAEVDYSVGGHAHHVPGEAVGLGSVGGISHSEQRVWNNARDAVFQALSHAGANVAVTFTVDEKICHLCTPWFENTVYPALSAAATQNHSTFTLNVTVNGNTVRITGGATVWPPEISDAPTFDRLGHMERSMRFLTENRDAAGNRNAQPQSPHVSDQVALIQDLVDTWQHFGLTLATIEDHFNEGKADSIRVNEGRFDEDTAEETMQEYCDTLTFYDALSEGRITVPPIYVEEATNPAESVEAWLRQFQLAFNYWFTDQMEEHFPQVQGENPHVSSR